MKRYNLLLTGFLLLFATATVRAQTADALIAKYVQAIGSKEKWSAIQSLVITGTQSIQSMELPFTISQKSPNLMKLEATLQGQSFVQCYDGKSAWTINPFMGSGKPELMPADQAKDFAERAAIKPELIDYAAKGAKASLAGKETIGGVSYDKILLTSKEGTVKTFYYDPATSFIAGMHNTLTSGQMAGKMIETLFADYRDEGGIKVPHKLTMNLDGKPFSTITYKSVQVNAPVDEKIFVMPAAK